MCAVVSTNNRFPLSKLKCHYTFMTYLELSQSVNFLVLLKVQVVTVTMMLRSLYGLKSLTIFTYCLHNACCSELLEILEQTTPFTIYRHSFYRQNASISLCKIKPVGRPTLLFHVQIMHCRLQHISCMYAITTYMYLASRLFTHHTIHMKLFLLQYISLDIFRNRLCHLCLWYLD